MRKRRVALAVVALFLAGSTSASTSAQDRVERGPFLLVTLPAALGTVTWRCNPSMEPGVARGLPGLALGFRVPPVGRGSTTRLRFQAGGRAVSVRAQPGESIRFPYVRSRVQRLTVGPGHGGGPAARTRVLVTVDFAPGIWPSGGPHSRPYCVWHLPPRVEVLVLPRGS